MRASYWLVTLPLIAILGACTSQAPRTSDIDGYPDDPRDVAGVPDPVPKRESRSKYGNPSSYRVLGNTYYTLDSSGGFVERGMASFYGTKFHGRRTSSGETYDMYKMTAAHKTLPLPTYVEVTNLDNRRRVVVKVNDRGPFHANRVIDLSYAAATKLGIAERGTGRVEISAIDPDNPTAHRQAGGGEAARHAAETTGDANLYVQAGAFSLRTNAETLRQKLAEEHGREVVIRPRNDKGLKLYRVYLGPLASTDEAETLTRALRLTGIKGAHPVVD
jgi:rare lipoprotein A